MPSVNGIEIELENILSSPYYASIFYNLNAFRTKAFDRRQKNPQEPYTPALVARQTAKAIVDNRMLIDPVEIGELIGPVELYRAHDGGSKSKTSAGTLGRCWMKRELVENLWISTAGMNDGRNRKSHFIELMRSCNLVLFEWNAMTHLACMKVPDGCRVAVVAGEGNWKAMMPGEAHRAGAGLSEGPNKGLIRQLSRMAKEPTVQYVVPVFNAMWVQPVNENKPNWPLAS